MNKTKKILIVDDEENARLYLANILLELFPDFDVQFSSTPAEALFLLSKNTFDAVLLDVEMPGMTGLDMVKKIREFTSNLPVIFVSAFHNATFIQNALRLKAIDYLDKPVNPDELRLALGRALQQNENSKIIERKKIGDRFCLLTESGEMFFGADEVVCFWSAKRYATAELADGSKKLIRENLEKLRSKLPPDCYLRVSRQAIINLRYVKLISKTNKTIVLQNAKCQIVVPKVYPYIFEQLIGKK